MGPSRTSSRAKPPDTLNQHSKTHTPMSIFSLLQQGNAPKQAKSATIQGNSIRQIQDDAAAALIKTSVVVAACARDKQLNIQRA